MTVFPCVPSMEMVLFRYKCVSLSGFNSYVFSSSFIVLWSLHSSIRFPISPVSVVSDADTIPIAKNKINENNNSLYNFLIISPSYCILYVTIIIFKVFFKLLL